MRYLLWLALPLLGCSPGDRSASPGLLKAFPIDGSETVLTRNGVSLDAGVTADGNGSLRLEATEPTTFRLFKITDPDVDEARLLFRAKLRTENVRGALFLEMWCKFPELGEFFSRGLDQPLSGTVEWTRGEIPFFLRKGQKPSLVRLNVVLNGTGTAWVDDVALLRAPLP